MYTILVKFQGLGILGNRRECQASFEEESFVGAVSQETRFPKITLLFSSSVSRPLPVSVAI